MTYLTPLCNLSVFSFLFLLLACQPSPQQVSDSKLYSCNEGRQLRATFSRTSLLLVWVDDPAQEELILEQVPAASGARYSDGSWTFWDKGPEAVLMKNEAILWRCQL